MRVVVQGQSREVPQNCSIEMLLALLGLVSSACLVEVNGEVPPRNQWSQFFLKDGDRVEIFRVSAGG